MERQKRKQNVVMLQLLNIVKMTRIVGGLVTVVIPRRE